MNAKAFVGLYCGLVISRGCDVEEEISLLLSLDTQLAMEVVFSIHAL
jgi:hypothetical protein